MVGDMHTRVLIFALVLVAMVCLLLPARWVVSQGSITATPVPVSLPSPLPFGSVVEASPTPAIITSDGGAATAPADIGPVMLEALSEANIRSQPDPESERLGSIQIGTLYPVLGRYYRWYQFQYDLENGSTGWVYDELVRIVGDETAITDLAAQEQADTAPDLDATATVASLQQTPGGIETATASSGSIPLPALPGVGNNSMDASPTPPVTFAVRATFTLSAAISVPSSSPIVVAQERGNSTNIVTSLPPIFPILLLGGFGIIGLLVSSYRK